MSLAIEMAPNWLQRRIGHNLMKHTTERKFIRNIINCMITARGGWQRGLDPRFYDCTRKEIRPSETKY